jgi:hypothetical protein
MRADQLTIHTAAPELLEALQELLFRFKRVAADFTGEIDPADEKRIAMAEAAIRKARGEK